MGTDSDVFDGRVYEGFGGRTSQHDFAMSGTVAQYDDIDFGCVASKIQQGPVLESIVIVRVSWICMMLGEAHDADGDTL